MNAEKQIKNASEFSIVDKFIWNWFELNNIFNRHEQIFSNVGKIKLGADCEW